MPFSQEWAQSQHLIAWSLWWKYDFLSPNKITSSQTREEITQNYQFYSLSRVLKVHKFWFNNSIATALYQGSNPKHRKNFTPKNNFHWVIYKKEEISSGWCGSVDWVLAWKPRSHQFNSQLGHILWARSPVGGTWVATTHWCSSLSKN